jgi:hypothetical protein
VRTRSTRREWSRAASACRARPPRGARARACPPSCSITARAPSVRPPVHPVERRREGEHGAGSGDRGPRPSRQGRAGRGRWADEAPASRAASSSTGTRHGTSVRRRAGQVSSGIGVRPRRTRPKRYTQDAERLAGLFAAVRRPARGHPRGRAVELLPHVGRRAVRAAAGQHRGVPRGERVAGRWVPRDQVEDGRAAGRGAGPRLGVPTSYQPERRPWRGGGRVLVAHPAMPTSTGGTASSRRS